LPAGGAALKSGLRVIGAHIGLLGGGVGLLFLQRYISLLGLEARGFGPYQTASYLLLLSGDGGSLRAGQAPLGPEKVPL